MRTDQLRMNICRLGLVFAATVLSASCSEKSSPDREKQRSQAQRESQVEKGEREGDRQPREDQITQDCLAFVSATKILSAQQAKTDCPGCPAGGKEVLSFRHVETDAISCARDTCNVRATIRAVFNPGSGEEIGGGLTAWIPPEQRSAYLSGQTPEGEQTFRVQITYKRRGNRWRAVEFDRAPAQ